MEKEFIPYEQALALKELGFDEPCFGKFYHNHLEIGGSWLNSEFNKDKTDGNIFTSAPTFSQVFRWFREKYKLCGLIEIGTQEFSYQVFNNKGNRQLGTEPISYNGTYEEAELECLKKLIEIIKEKK